MPESILRNESPALNGRTALSTERRVEPELLDELSATDPRAVRSRRDLQRLNDWMGNGRIMAQALNDCLAGRAGWRLAELGAGDGTFLLGLMRRLGASRASEAVLVDKQQIVTPETQTALRELGCQADAVSADVFNWLSQPVREPWDVIVANLFLHHFTDSQLASLLALAADRTRIFVTVEPRRWGWSLLGSRLVWLIGCNAVTRHDAVVSVRAGFAGQELSGLWPADGTWALEELPANWSSHLFVAQRLAH